MVVHKSVTRLDAGDMGKSNTLIEEVTGLTNKTLWWPSHSPLSPFLPVPPSLSILQCLPCLMEFTVPKGGRTDRWREKGEWEGGKIWTLAGRANSAHESVVHGPSSCAPIVSQHISSSPTFVSRCLSSKRKQKRGRGGEETRQPPSALQDDMKRGYELMDVIEKWPFLPDGLK